jgi:hypothetical protein
LLKIERKKADKGAVDGVVLLEEGFAGLYPMPFGPQAPFPSEKILNATMHWIVALR